ncbi:MAG TPA: phenylalanine--tRNA ligase subunit alpha, partial [Leptospiraceae bacterium]|nr:phenylalanine--tRNA ligase subunit alpha [Leptospiraceae bacterium]
MSLLDDLNAILKEANDVLPTSKTEIDLDTNKNLFVGKKGKLTGVMKGLGALSPEEKKTIGARANEVSKEIEDLVNKLKQKIKLDFYENELKNEKFDTLRPLQSRDLGGLHPLSRIQYEVEDIFTSMGFQIMDG